MNFVPASLFGRTLLVLALGLVLAQAVSIALNLYDRSSSVYRLAAYQVALRISQAARIVNRAPPELRPKILEEIESGDLSVMLRPRPLEITGGFDEHDRYETALANSIRSRLDKNWPLKVQITSLPKKTAARVASPADDGSFEKWVARHFYFVLPGAYAVVVQVGLEDGSTAVFYASIPQESLSRMESLVPRLALSLGIFIILAAVLVRMITRSLAELARAAEALGASPEGSPLVEQGPSEVRRTIAAFNSMQGRIRSFIQERAQLLGAMSHDLKTPITRMRLRSEMLADPALREKFQRDLAEMESMVGETLEFFSSLGSQPARHPVDVHALAESVAEDLREAGHRVSVRGSRASPYTGHPQALRRCLDNLVGNALRYGTRADIEIVDTAEALHVRVRDDGPGIPEAELEKVFEPFYRLERSRNRESGGTGLGLSIARNIARWHGGEILLRNVPGGAGLEAELMLPRGPSARAAPERTAAAR